MKLNELLNDAKNYIKGDIKISDGVDTDVEITGITDDSRNVACGNIFVCVKGATFDGADKAGEVLNNGARFIVCDKDLGFGDKQIITDDTRKFYGILCSAWYDHPEKKLRLIGVTGTNGKTTMATMMSFMLESFGKNVGLIGTTGVFIKGKEIERDDSTPTTPKVSELMKIFAEMANAGCEYAVMEVTSFALEQNRIGPARFEVGIFTNLTQDHLDYHKTMENYYLAKKKLFTESSDFATVNISDDYGKRLFSEINIPKKSYGFDKSADIYADNISHVSGGMEFDFHADKINHRIRLNMVGGYNVLNATAAIECMLTLGFDIEEIAGAMNKFTGVRGRCEIIPTGRDFTVVCDYAHSPDALEKMLASVKESTKNRLICLFGCGGDRDKTKRPKMAMAVLKYADHIIVTSDNPRTEDPEAIIDDIVAGFDDKTSYDRISDRRKAIYHGLKIAESGDILVLAGKGHEDYQILGKTHIHFDEREVVKDGLEEIFPKRETLTLDEICTAVKGKAFGEKYNGETKIFADEISSDSRTIKKGALFIGIKGDNFDGNSYAVKAVTEKCAVCAITNKAFEGIPCIVVSDTKKALLDIAKYFRSKFSPIVIGVTGSVGKTTSKEFIALALSSKYKTLKTEGNLNNDIGMPFTILKMTSQTKAAVIEMGMNHRGEIRKLSEVSKPDICVITNIGYSHIENLGSRENILKEKLDIACTGDEKSPVIVNGDNEYLKKASRYIPTHKLVSCGINNRECEFCAENIVQGEEKLDFDIVSEGINIAHCTLPVFGKHYVTDALIAVAAAKYAGCDAKEAARKLSEYVPTGLRQHILNKNGQKVIVDCYNAAPDSMMAAMDVLGEMPCENKRICVFADMLELGDFSEELHRQVGKYAAESRVDNFVCYGKLSEYAYDEAKKSGVDSKYFTDFSELVNYLKSVLKKGDSILFKGSRRMALEDAVKAIYGENV